MNRILRNFSNEDKRGHERKEGRKNVEKRWKQTKKRRMKVFTLFKLVKHKAFKRSCKVVLTDYSNLNLETSTECFVWSWWKKQEGCVIKIFVLGKREGDMLRNVLRLLWTELPNPIPNVHKHTPKMGNLDYVLNKQTDTQRHYSPPLHPY